MNPFLGVFPPFLLPRGANDTIFFTTYLNNSCSKYTWSFESHFWGSHRFWGGHVAPGLVNSSSLLLKKLIWGYWS